MDLIYYSLKLQKNRNMMRKFPIEKEINSQNWGIWGEDQEI